MRSLFRDRRARREAVKATVAAEQRKGRAPAVKPERRRAPRSSEEPGMVIEIPELELQR